MLLLAFQMVTAAAQPNIMLVVADDLGYNDVGFEEPNYSFVQTPHLNALAKKGVRFSNHHVCRHRIDIYTVHIDVHSRTAPMQNATTCL